ncbi:MAG: hypothetical protein HKN91_01650 [Acidimicrobiia bacterium]|nr:hypothetical protein [Acidimicrobiia bacterium]
MGRFDEIPGGAPSFRAHNAMFWLDDGIMLGKHLPHEPNVTLEDVIEAFQKFKGMTGGELVPFVVDARGLARLGYDARAYIRASSPEVFSHIAIVVKPELIRLLSHAFIGVSGMEVPVQLFTDEEEAWSFATAHRSDAA